jgi:lipopolysaccharide export system permease protein
MSFISAVAAVAALRGLGFVGTVAGSTKPIALLVPYLALLVAFALGAWGITRGIIIEPPAFISNAISAAIERMSRRTAALSGQAP